MRNGTLVEALVPDRRKRARIGWCGLFLFVLAAGLRASAAQVTANEDRVAFERAMSHLRAGNRSGAASEAKKARGHDTDWGKKADLMLSLLDALRQNDDRITQIRAALRAKNQSAACGILAKLDADIAAWPQANEKELRLGYYYNDLPRLKREVGDCRPDLATLTTDQQKKLDEAKSQADRERYDEAIAALRDLAKQKPENTEVSQLLDQVLRRKSRQEQQSVQDRCNAICDKAESEAAVGLFSQGLERLQDAGPLRVCGKRVDTLEKKFQAALAEESKALGDAINLYYKGEYSKSQAMLRAFQQGKHAETRLELARFYLAAALGSEYYLDRETTTEKKKEAMTLLAALKDPTAYMKMVSPRIRRLWEEAKNPANKQSESGVYP
jgi:hypothetical protein